MQTSTSFVTGANTGLGKETARALAERGDKVIIACRDEAKGRAAIAEISESTGNTSLEYLELDLADLTQIRSAAKQLLERGDEINVLVANAGVAGQRGVTAQGFELAFGINHLGHFLFVHQLLPLLTKASSPGNPARVVVVASGSHFEAKKGINYAELQQSTRSFSGMPEYAVSKLANVMFAQELARRTNPDELFAVSLHPGNLIATDVMRRIPKPIELAFKLFRPSAKTGAMTSVMCATSDAVLENRGGYYSVLKTKRPSALANETAGEELWRRSEEWVAQFE